MPELPEVETIKLGLQPKILNKEIVDLVVSKDKIVKNNTKQFIDSLLGNRFVDIDRVGKLLIFVLPDDKYLLVHLKMTGQLIYVKKEDRVAGGHNWPPVETLPNKYSHIIFSFADNSKLFFNDLRQFGYLKLVDEKGRQNAVQKHGIQPTDKSFTLDNFKELFKNRKTILKALLLNQQVISGTGNIYADEICFRAKILPSRRANTLSSDEIKRLWQSSKYIIQKAIEKRGTTFSDYRDASGDKGGFVKFLKVYGRKDKRCLRCKKANIKKIKLAGRGTHYCPNCQK